MQAHSGRWEGSGDSVHLSAEKSGEIKALYPSSLIFLIWSSAQGAVAWLHISFRCVKASLGSGGDSEAKCTHGA